MNYNEYIDLINTEYFPVCRDKSVLEIGPNTGYHSDLIVQHCPSRFITVEPDLDCVQGLKSRFPEESIIHNDILFYLDSSRPFDVVVCFGVLYHLHNPLYLLEVIVNRCAPEYVLLDCTNCYNSVKFLPEEDNIVGNRQTLNNWKSAGFNLVPPLGIVESSMNNLGYKQVRLDILTVDDYFPKSNSWAGIWKRV